MYMNNAAELLTQGQIDDAYWWARGVIEGPAIGIRTARWVSSTDVW
jgi:hypothetical protein